MKEIQTDVDNCNKRGAILTSEVWCVKVSKYIILENIICLDEGICATLSCEKDKTASFKFFVSVRKLENVMYIFSVSKLTLARVVTGGVRF